jgi:hypothetical protein
MDSLSAEACTVIQLIARAIVGHKDAVSVVSFASTNDLTVIELRVSMGSDTGKVIGRQGRMALSLRTVLGAIGKEQGKSYRLDIIENPE